MRAGFGTTIALAVFLSFLAYAHGADSCSAAQRYCIGPTCGVSFGDLGSTSNCGPCRDADFDAEVTSCQDGSRSLIYYWKPPATCREGVDLPLPVTDISCDVQCGPGEKLTENKVCEQCAAGYYSVGGGYLFADWSTLPSQFETYCSLVYDPYYSSGTQEVTCNGWEPLGNSIMSTCNSTTESHLSLTVRLVRDGEISFTYRVESEPTYDGLRFFDNGAELLKLVSSQPQFTTANFSISAGLHVFSWVYSKDFSVDWGMDAAEIQSITVTGVSEMATECFACPPGTYASEVGSSSCEPCPANTRSSVPGSTECIACDPAKYSWEGSTTCIPRPRCTQNDLYFTDGPCDHSTETFVRSWSLKEGVVCNAENFHLPEDETLECPEALCVPGFEKVDHTCVMCEPGTYSSASGPCMPCSGGHEAPRARYFEHFTYLSEEFTTTCEGANCNGVWRPASSLEGRVLESGEGHGRQADVNLQLDISQLEMYRDGEVSFNYTVMCRIPDGGYYRYNGLKFYIDGTLMASYACETSGQDRFHLPQDTSEVMWQFHKASSLHHPEDKAVLQEIVIFGSNQGGATSCVVCQPGTHSHSGTDTCHNCPAGFYADEAGMDDCNACPANTFSDKPGGRGCETCGEGMSSSGGSSECVSDGCAYTSPTGAQYGLAALSSSSIMNEVLDPKMIYRTSTISTNTIYIDLCHRAGSLTNCVADGAEHNVYACVNDPFHNRVIELGRSLWFTTHNVTTGGVDTEQLAIIMTSIDDTCYAGSSVYQPYRVIVDMVCNPAAAEDTKPVLATYDTCDFGIVWENPHACRLCTEQDLSRLYSECVNGERTVTRYVRDGTLCLDTLPMSAKVTIEPCQEVSEDEVAVAYVVVLAGIAAFAVLGLLAVFFLTQYQKYKNLYSEYERVRTNDPSMEMGPIRHSDDLKSGGAPDDGNFELGDDDDLLDGSMSRSV